MSNAERIEVVVNGEVRTVAAGLTIRMLLPALGVVADRVAVELNREIVGRGKWDSTVVGAGAQIEIVQFVGGG